MARSIKKNIFANYLGQGYSTVVGFAVIPFYIAKLGIEAYGLIGLYTLVRSWIALLDLGMKPAVARSFASARSNDRSSAEQARDTLFTLISIASVFALGFALLAQIFSGWFSRSWLSLDDLTDGAAVTSIKLIGVLVGLSFVEAIQRNALVGLQRHGVLNAILASAATLRAVGGVAVLHLVAPDIRALFAWFIVCAILNLIVQQVAVSRMAPTIDRKARFSVAQIARLKGFLTGVSGIAVASFLASKADRIVVSASCSLEEFGGYSLAAVLSGALFMVLSPVIQAYFPRVASLHASGERKAMIRLFHLNAQLVTCTVCVIAMNLFAFAPVVLEVVVDEEQQSIGLARVFQAMALSAGVNAMLWTPRQTQLAEGETRRPFISSSAGALLTWPLLLLAVPRFGTIGAAWSVLTVNIISVLFLSALEFNGATERERGRWLLRDLALPIAAAIPVIFLAHRSMPAELTRSSVLGLAYVAGTVGLSCGASVLATGQLREVAARMVRSRIARGGRA